VIEVSATPAPFVLPRSSNALRCVAGHSAWPFSTASLHHMGVMFAGTSMPVVGGVVR